MYIFLFVLIFLPCASVAQLVDTANCEEFVWAVALVNLQS